MVSSSSWQLGEHQIVSQHQSIAFVTTSEPQNVLKQHDDSW